MFEKHLYRGFYTPLYSDLPIGLCPVQRGRATYLRIGIGVDLFGELVPIYLGLDQHLLSFHIVSRISLVINAPIVKPSAAHQPAPARNQNEIDIHGRLRVSHISLDHWHHPVRGDLLNPELFVQIVIPHIAHVKSLEGVLLGAMIYQIAVSSLTIGSDVEALRGYIKSAFKELLDALSDGIELVLYGLPDWL